MSFVIGIDGYFRTGKTTLAKALAQKYNAIILDIGILYRIVASLLLKKHLSEKEITQIVSTKSLDELMHLLGIEYDYLEKRFSPILDDLYSTEVSMMSATVGATTQDSWYPTFFSIVKQLNQSFNIILVGRNLLNIYPEMNMHIFLTSSTDKTIQIILSDDPTLTYEQAKSMAMSRMQIERQIYYGSLDEQFTIFLDVSDKNAKEVFHHACNLIENQLHT